MAASEFDLRQVGSGELRYFEFSIWTAQLSGIWNDVTAGDNMTTVVLPGRKTLFYDQRGRVGQIDDPRFGPAFLNIWLGRQSVVGDLRAELLGLE